MNLSQLRDRVRALTGIRLDTIRSDEQIDAVINESYYEAMNLGSWPFLKVSTTVTVAAGAEEFTTPTGYDEISSLTYSTSQQDQTRLRQTTMDELDFLDEDEEGDPAFYARIDETKIRIWPRPTSSITFSVRGKAAVSELSSDSDEPVFGDQFHTMLAYRSASKILAEESDDSNRSNAYQEEANVIFARMQRFYLTSNDHGLIVMGSNRRRRLIDGR